MRQLIAEIIVVSLMILGTFLILIASIGVLRMPDLFLRMSAATKAATVGAASLLVAAAFNFNELDITAQMIATIFFLLLTAPVGAHIIGRAAYKHNKFDLYERTVTDELKTYYEQKPD